MNKLIFLGTGSADISEFIQTQHLMAISTFGDAPWVCTVFFVADEGLNLYFVSDPSSTHCSQITKNPEVAVSIFDSHQQVSDKKIGVQMKGRAAQLADPEIIRKTLHLWNAHNPGFEHIITAESMEKDTIHSKVYKISPVYAKFFNEKLYGPEGERELYF